MQPNPLMLSFTRQPERAQEWTAELLLVLTQCYGFRIVFTLPHRQEVRVTTPHDAHWCEWYISDNGGELGVSPVNDIAHRLPPRVDVQFTEGGSVLDAGTVAYRVACRTQGAAIDITHRCPELIDVARSMATPINGR